MSTYWGLYCETCNDESAHWYNHGDAQLELLVQHWPAIKKVYELRESLWRLEMHMPGSDALAFMDEHDGHDIVLASEYGDRRSVEKVAT